MVTNPRRILDKYNRNIGQKVKKRRLALKLTVDQLSNLSGLIPNYIRCLEMGVGGYQTDKGLSTIAAALGVSVKNLTEGSK